MKFATKDEKMPTTRKDIEIEHLLDILRKPDLEELSEIHCGLERPYTYERGELIFYLMGCVNTEMRLDVLEHVVRELSEQQQALELRMDNLRHVIRRTPG